MGFFNKKNDIPKLPKAPALPSIPNMPKTSTELPTLPKTNFGENLNQEIVKSAISDIPHENNETPSFPEVLHHPSEESGEIELPQTPHHLPTQAIQNIPITNQLHAQMPTPIPSPSLIKQKNTIETETVFVKIAKFQEAQKDFELIKKNIKEIENTLSKIKEKKEKEDLILSQWISEIEELKSKLTKIDSNIFNKI